MNLGGVDVDFLLYLNARLGPAGGRMEESFTSVIPRYYEIECPRVAGPGRSPLLIALHGYQGDKDSMMRVARRIAPASMVVISLQGQNQFFVMSQSQVSSLIRDELTRLKRPDNYPVTAIVWKLVLKHKDAWHVLPT